MTEDEAYIERLRAELDLLRTVLESLEDAYIANKGGKQYEFVRTKTGSHPKTIELWNQVRKAIRETTHD